jgi:hypothetical protein
MGEAGPKGRKRASRVAIDGENGVIPCANTASPPFPSALSRLAFPQELKGTPPCVTARVAAGAI